MMNNLLTLQLILYPLMENLCQRIAS